MPEERRSGQKYDREMSEEVSSRPLADRTARLEVSFCPKPKFQTECEAHVARSGKFKHQAQAHPPPTRHPPSAPSGQERPKIPHPPAAAPRSHRAGAAARQKQHQRRLAPSNPNPPPPERGAQAPKLSEPDTGACLPRNSGYKGREPRGRGPREERGSLPLQAREARAPPGGDVKFAGAVAGGADGSRGRGLRLSLDDRQSIAPKAARHEGPQEQDVDGDQSDA